MLETTPAWQIFAVIVACVVMIAVILYAVKHREQKPRDPINRKDHPYADPYPDKEK